MLITMVKLFGIVLSLIPIIIICFAVALLAIWLVGTIRDKRK